MRTALAVLMMAPTLAAAEPYLSAGIGAVGFRSIPNEVNNARFCDTGFQCDSDVNGSNLQLGLGYRFDEKRAGLRWSVEGAYARAGVMKLHSAFPQDVNYDVPSSTCLRECGESDLIRFRGDWHVNAARLSLIGAYEMGDWSAYGKLGVVVAHVDGSAAYTVPASLGGYTVDCSAPGDGACRVQGWRFGGSLGVGVSYDGWRARPFLEIEQTRTSGQGYPGFSQWTTVTAGVRVAF